MAFFRCGGSGIPASLKSGMNSVLNKKFGTSTTYDPAGWPDDVNLLGPLPVKTASGAIASFTDGADGVPVKSCTVSFLPSGGGGTPSAPVAIVGHSGITLTNKDNMSTPTHTDTYTDTFGHTIYGGTRDLTTDKASVTYGVKNARDYTWTTITQGSDLFFVTVDETLKATGQSATFLCNRFTTINTSAYLPATPTNNTMYHASARYYNINVFSDVASNITEWNTYIQNNDVVFTIPLATPTEITGLTPHEIDTLYGDNNIYADTGTTTVEYRADIDLALNA